jgi:group I intron endonuclease
MFIYRITNTKNGKKYIGQTSKSLEERFNAHAKHAKNKVNRHLYDAMNCYGVESFVIEMIETCSSKEELDDREKFWIQEENTFTPNGYNMTLGGGGGNTLTSWSEEDKKALYKQQGDKRRGKRPQSWRDSIQAAAILREANRTPEDRAELNARVSSTLKRRYADGEIKPVMPPLRYGKDNPNHVEVDIPTVLGYIESGMKLIWIAEELGTSKQTVHGKLKAATGKTYNEWKQHYAND